MGGGKGKGKGDVGVDGTLPRKNVESFQGNSMYGDRNKGMIDWPLVFQQERERVRELTDRRGPDPNDPIQPINDGNMVPFPSLLRTVEPRKASIATLPQIARPTEPPSAVAGRACRSQHRALTSFALLLAAGCDGQGVGGEGRGETGAERQQETENGTPTPIGLMV
jgi:hypothetical protein